MGAVASHSGAGDSRIRFRTRFLLTVCLVLPVADAAAAEVTISAVANGAVIPWTRTLQIGGDGLGLIAYTDSPLGRGLKVAHCNDAMCTSATTSTLDGAVVLGQGSIALAIGADGLGLIAHVDNPGSGPLRVAHCNDATCTTAGATTIEGGGVGVTPSIAVGRDGLGLISYLDTTNHDLKVAHCNDTACTSASTATLDSAGSVGGFGSITIGGDGLGLISYYDETNAHLKVAHCSDAACTSATLTTIDSDPRAGLETSIATGSDGFGLISYTDFNTAALKIAHCENAACTGAGITTLDRYGRASSIAVARDGLGLISYFTTPQNIKVAHCNDVGCTSAVAAVFGQGLLESSITKGVDGVPLLAFVSTSPTVLKVAHGFDPRNILSLSVDDVAVTEGNSGTTDASFTVSLSAVATTSVTVQYATAEGGVNSATSGVDFLPTSGTLTFAPGETSKPVVVPVVGDTQYEVDETFLLSLFNASGAIISRSPGTCTIRNDDPLLTLSIGDATVSEGSSGTSNATFSVTLSPAPSSPVTVDYATAEGSVNPASSGVDFLPTSGTLTFAPGDTTKTITVAVVGDTRFEPDETFFVDLKNASGAVFARSRGVGTILNDDTRPQPLWHASFAVASLETPMVGDFNGDGKADIITFTRQNAAAFGDVFVALSDGARFGSASKWHDWFAISTAETVVIGDYDGDGKDDIATWLGTTTRQVYVALSQGASFSTERVWIDSIGFDPTDVLMAGDVNGDGKKDLILFARKLGKVYVALSDGTKFLPPTIWHNFFAVSTYERPRVGDVNGDGKADIITFATDSPTAFGDVYVAVSNGTRFVDLNGIANNSSKWHDFFVISPSEEVRIGDLNGDHRDDFFTFLPHPSGQCHTAESTGTSMGTSVLWREDVVPLPGDTAFVADVNGDGKADIIVFARSEGKVYVSLAQ